jgi:hypothetical protein
MNLHKAAALLLVLLPTVALAKTKKPEVPAVFGNARFVYVESPDGDLFKPGVYPEDRTAISDVQDALRDWNRYVLTTHREEAELVFVVRKGRLASGQLHGGVQIGQPLPPGQMPGHGPGQSGSGDSVGTRAEVGPEDDMLEVYMLNPEGKLTGPIWNRSQTDGLNAPQLQLLRQLRDAVERAYPATTAGKQSKP